MNKEIMEAYPFIMKTVGNIELKEGGPLWYWGVGERVCEAGLINGAGEK